MKRALLISALLAVLVAVPAATFAENSQEYTKAKLEWSQANYKVTTGIRTAKIILVDPDIQNIHHNTTKNQKDFLINLK